MGKISESHKVECLSAVNTFTFRIKIWYENYKKFLFLLIPLFLIGLFGIFKFSLYKNKAEGEFLSAKNAYLQWETSKEWEGKSFETLKKFLKKYPELAAPYESLILQKVFAIGKPAKEDPFVEALFQKKLQKSTNYYAQFANTSILIEKQEFETALKEAASLKTAMLTDEEFWRSQKNPHFGSLLFAFNLVRIGMLSKQLGKGEEELLAWKELQHYANWEKLENGEHFLDEKAFDSLLHNFTDRGVSIKDYIKHREEKLSAKIS